MTDQIIEMNFHNRETAIKEHRKMWNWIADTAEKEHRFVTKEEYIYQSHLKYNKLVSNCFCCDYAVRKISVLANFEKANDICDYCPLVWHKGNKTFLVPPCCHNESPYTKFLEAASENNIKDCVKYSREIANLPEVRKDDE